LLKQKHGSEAASKRKKLNSMQKRLQAFDRGAIAAVSKIMVVI
jgi:hypothetical protein